MGWRLRLLVVAALLGCVALVMTARWLAAQPHLPADWRVGAQGEIELVHTDDAALKPLEGRALVGLLNDNGQVAIVDGLALQRSPRWITSDAQRERHLDQHQQVAAVMGGSAVRAFFIGGRQVELALQPRGLTRLGTMFWVLSALSLTLYLWRCGAAGQAVDAQTCCMPWPRCARPAALPSWPSSRRCNSGCRSASCAGTCRCGWPSTC